MCGNIIMVSPDDYFNKIREVDYAPQNPFAHAHGMISEPKKVDGFNKLLQSHILNANISSDRLMRAYQTQAFLLVQMYAMSLRDEGFKEVFNVLYNSFLIEISMTRAKDGTERKLQASVGNYKGDGELSGFGGDIKDMKDEDLKNLAELIYGSKKR